MSRSQQHGGVAIVAAGMHLSRVHAGVGKGVRLLHGQGVHVGTQANSPCGRARLDDAHHAGGAQAPVDGNAPFGQLGRHHVGGAHFLKAKLGVGVQVAAYGGNGWGVVDDGFDQMHKWALENSAK